MRRLVWMVSFLCACSSSASSEPPIDAATTPDALVEVATDAPGESESDATSGDVDAPTSKLRPVPDPLYGVTIDGIDPLADIVASLSKLSHMPTTRIVFDETQKPSDYAEAVKAIRPVSYVMGLVVDSFYVKSFTKEQYEQRTIDYVDAFADEVDIWEIGNEINGDPWLGPTSEVVPKMTAAYDVVKKRGLRTALTLYYNDGCWDAPDHEMFAWTEKNVPPSMKAGLDYVLVSYYEDDCTGPKPDWPTVFAKLAAMFPASKVGFGECGTERPAAKSEFVTRYYGTKIPSIPRYVGGYFWWYYRQDMVPYTTPLWSVLNGAIK